MAKRPNYQLKYKDLRNEFHKQNFRNDTMVIQVEHYQIQFM